MYELDITDYPEVRPLFAELADYQIMARGTLHGARPGQIYVDDPTHPQSAFLCARVRHFLAGNPTNRAFNQALADFIASPEFIHDPNRSHPDRLILDCHPAEWREQFAMLFGALLPAEISRRHYRFRQFPWDWRTRLPAGFIARPIDQDLLANDQLKNIQGVRRWAHLNWNQAGGVCLQRGDEIASWCLPVAISGNACELGIETVPFYRQQGLGALATMATVDWCLERGLTVIGWHCDASNRASWSVAEKSGFVLERNYTHYLRFFDLAAHYAASGESRRQEENYPAALPRIASG